MTDALDLPGLGVLRIHPATPASASEGGRVRRVEVEPTFIPTACPKCQSTRLYRHGLRRQSYADAPHFGEPTVLEVHRRRWRCRDCKTLFPDPLPEMDENRRATSRLIRFVQSRTLEHTFASIGRDVGISDVSVRHIFDDMVHDLEHRYRFATPRWLGIDEVKIIGKYRCILTNVEKNTVYDLLDSRTLADLRTYFRQFPNRKDVELFSTDLWNNYATVAREFFPDAIVVADRFHIQRMGTNGMEAARKAIRKGLTRKVRLQLKDERHVLLKHGSRLNDHEREILGAIHRDFPSLALAWRCKERFFAIWEQTDRQSASEAMDAWIASVPPEMAVFFKEALSALATRRDHILNYFDHRITNAYTESINRLAKSINRMGRGYSLEVIRAKMLYDTNALEKGTMVERVATPVLDDDAGGLGVGYMTYTTARSVRSRVRYDTRLVCYGAHIPTLCDKLEAGVFEDQPAGFQPASP